MKKLALLLRYEARILSAGRTAAIGLLSILAFGAYGVYHGHAQVARQRRVLSEIPALQKPALNYLQQTYPDQDSGLLGYEMFLPTSHRPSSWAGLALGQSDINPYSLRVRLLGIQSQLYDTELLNPQTLLSGNFDLAFVIVFLFPLLIVAMTYNLFSEERESGTLGLLLSQPTPLWRVLAIRIWLRVAAVFAAGFLLLFSGMQWTGAAWDARALAWGSVMAAYFIFWFAVSLCVIGLRRSSAFNAAALLGLWLAAAVVLPALMNLLTSTYYPVPQGIAITLKQRQETHVGWDLPKEDTFAKFFRRHPEWSGIKVVKDKFSWSWYYAMQEAGDDSAQDLAGIYRDRLARRQKLAERLGIFSPPLAAQLLFDKIAQTDLPSHLAYLDSVKEFHRQMKSFLYPLIFDNKPLRNEDYGRLPSHHFIPPAPLDGFPAGLMRLMLAAIVCGSAAPAIFIAVGRRAD